MSGRRPVGLPPGFTGFPFVGRPGPNGPQYPGTSGPVDGDITYQNPSGAYPGMRAPSNLGWWKSGDIQLRWTNRAEDANNVVFNRQFEQIGLDAATCTARTIWQTPVIDLRPDLRNAMGSDQTESIPMGPGSTVFAKIEPMDFAVIADLPANLEVYTFESGHASNPSLVESIKARQQISDDFYVGNQSTGLIWAPPPGAERFWRVTLIFDWTLVLAPGVPNVPPRLLLNGAVS